MSKKQARNTQPAKPAGMKKLEHWGYVIVQSPRNHHVMIGKDGRTVYHASYTKQLTEEERKLGEKSNRLREENYKSLRKNGNRVWHGKLAGQLLADVLEADFMEAI